MIDFKKLTLEDRDWVNACLAKADYRGCEYSFGNNFIWEGSHNIRTAEVEGFYCAISGKGDNIIYTYPAGAGDIKKVLELLIEDAKERGISFKMRGLIQEQTKQLEEIFPGMFECELRRDESDYLYTVEKLSKLSGKKLHGKRNHIARFKDCEDWEFIEITGENIHECKEMNERWCEKYNCDEKEGLKEELCAVERAFDYFNELGFCGGFIRRKGEVVAYSIGEPLSSDTFDVHIEKAFHDIQGAYPMINQQFVQHFCQDFKYVNREEDTGDMGLRKAKLSYYPDILLDKYEAVLK